MSNVPVRAEQPALPPKTLLTRIVESSPFKAVKAVVNILDSVGTAMGPFQAVPNALVEVIKTIEVRVAQKLLLG